VKSDGSATKHINNAALARTRQRLPGLLWAADGENTLLKQESSPLVKSRQLVPVISQINPAHTISKSFLKIHFNVAVPSNLCPYSSRYLTKYSNENALCTVYLSHACYVAHPIHSPSFDHPNSTGEDYKL